MGSDKRFDATLDENTKKSKREAWDKDLKESSAGCINQFHSPSTNNFHSKYTWCTCEMSDHIIAEISSEGAATLKWDDRCLSAKKLSFESKPIRENSSLFISCETELPPIFLTEVKSCKNMDEFKELLQRPDIWQTVIFYKITILETNAHITPI